MTDTSPSPRAPVPPAPNTAVKTRGTLWSLGALAAGLILGLLFHGSSGSFVPRLTAVIEPIGQLWVAALRMTVVPLVVAQILAVLGSRSERSVGAAGVKTLALFVIMLLAAAFLTLAVAPALISLYHVGPTTAASLRSAPTVALSSPEAPREKPASVGAWLVGLVPRNVFAALSSGEILPILLLAVAFALAVSHVAPERREPVVRLFRALADAMMILVAWILLAMPLGVFSLSYVLTVRAGFQVTGFVTFYIVLVSGLLLLATALLYPLTVLFGRSPLSRFARAVLPAQLVGVSTRSSLASLPALIEGGQEHLSLSGSATGFVLPLSVAVFKLNRMISSPVKLLVLAHVFQLHLGPFEIATFLAAEFLVSFGSAGVPGGGSSNMTALPAYLAVGIPLEGLLIVDAVDAIPDIFKTLLNVTADMSVATILSRSERADKAA